MTRSPSVNSVLSNGAGFQGSDLSTPISGSGKMMKDKVPFEDVHELLEEPVEEQVGASFSFIQELIYRISKF